MYQQIQLPTYPTTLPDDVEVRDFALDGGRYARVIMELRREVHNNVEHFVLYGQAYEMDASGNMVQAPVGYPSRSAQTPHSVIASAVGKTVFMDDAWCHHSENFNPMYPGDTVEVNEVPTTPGTHYGQTVFCTADGKVYKWTEGFADIVARTKIEDLLIVLNTSAVRSGFGFRNRANA